MFSLKSFSIFDYFKNWLVKKEIAHREKNIHSLLSSSTNAIEADTLDIAFIELIQDLEKILLKEKETLNRDEKIKLLELIFKLEKTKQLALINSCHHLSSDENKQGRLKKLFEKALAKQYQALFPHESLLVPLMVSSQTKHKIVLFEIQKNDPDNFNLKFFRTTEKGANFSHSQISSIPINFLKSHFFNHKIYFSKKITLLEKKEKFPEWVEMETSCHKILKVWLNEELESMPKLKNRVLFSSSNKIIPFSEN